MHPGLFINLVPFLIVQAFVNIPAVSERSTRCDFASSVIAIIAEIKVPVSPCGGTYSIGDCFG